MRNQE